ncbi:MAG: CoA protein activase [Actinobacteria bacterium]|nr:CoA protein activase [Actinomycetota bacterium]
MRVSTPRMGNLPLIVEDLACRFGIDYIEPPVFSEETVRIGASLAPEFACLPLKAVVGTFVQALEAGADTLLMGGGSGPCRFGYYAEIQRRILEKEGYRFELIILDPPSTSLKAAYSGLRSIVPPDVARFGTLVRELRRALAKVVVFDEIEKWGLALKGREAEPGSVERAAEEACSVTAAAFTGKEIRRARREVQQLFENVGLDDDRQCLRIGVVGEIFVVLEPYFNFDIGNWLGKRGVVVERSVHIADTAYPGGRNPVFGYDERQVARAAAPYLTHEVGGDGLLSVGATAIFARRGFDAVIHFLPFTCMPEVIAKSVLARVSEEMGIPVLSLTIDEQTGRAGVETRLEALLDLARSKRRRETIPLEGRFSTSPTGDLSLRGGSQPP